ncbi:MAG TPA: serine/threonine-protein kinase, partial [Thermoanaerobaculia bacterium]|nr:serine/threonine-protein kinase [Thermoanaerobaculia bacterium]
VCTLYEMEETPEGDLFLAMALCEGETLKSRLARGPLDLSEALDLAGQIAAGLAHAHSRSLVHRDVKPSNLMLTPAGPLKRVKIVDFGVAVRPTRPRLTREGSTVGTLSYMSPEQLRGGSVDHRADVWSLGVVLYEMLTGELPFDAPTDEAYAAAVLHGEPRPVHELRPGLPAWLWPPLARMLSRRPDLRPSRIEEAVRDLRAPGNPEALLAGTIPSAVPEVHPRVAELFVGRRDELALLARHLLPEPTEMLPAVVCAIQGMPGLGKSYLADRFALDHADDFPGGHLRLVLDPRTPAAPEALLEELADRLGVPGEEGLEERLRHRLCRPRVLLHLENVDSPAAEIVAGHLLRRLPGCTAVVTGRLHDLGLGLGWRPVRIAAFDEESALSQLWGELGWEPDGAERDGHRELVRSLGYLPLAIHLAAGHLRSGRSAAGFLRLLRQRRLAVEPADRTELSLGASGEARKVLAHSFELSLEIFREELGADAGPLLAGLQALGHAPLTGFGRSLGAGLAGLPEDDFEELAFHAQKLGLLLPVPREERPDGAWRLHPLLAEHLAVGVDAAEVRDRMTRWFLARLPAGEPADQGRRWQEVQRESTALTWWLPRMPAADQQRVQAVATLFAATNGPFHVWIEFCEAALQGALEPRQRADYLWTLCRVALRQGRLERAFQAAQEKLQADIEVENEFGAAVAWELIAEVRMRRGELDEAVAILQRQIQVFEKLGETRERAVAASRVAYALTLQERFDEALTVLHDDVVPFFERTGDVRSRAVALGMIADVLEARGNLDTALRIRQTEELPVYESLGEARSKAITMGKIARALHARGEHEAALKIRQEQERPIYERLGETRELAVCLGRIADIYRSLGRRDEAIRIRRSEQLPLLEQLGSAYELVAGQESLAQLHLERRRPGDREEAVTLLHRALEPAVRLRLPAEPRIRALLAEHGLAL